MTDSLRGKLAIVGAFDTEVGVLPGRTPTELCIEAALGAMEDAGIDKSGLDGIITCNAMAEPILYHAEAMAEYLQIFPRYCVSVNTGGGTTFTVLHHAASALATGMADVLETLEDMAQGLEPLSPDMPVPDALPENIG